MLSNEVHARVAVALLMELVHSAKHGNAAFKQMGIDAETMSDITSMNVAEIQELAETPFITYDIDNRTLNVRVQRILGRRKKDNLLNRAIQLGASRMVMKLYANMSHQEFTQRRTQLNLDDNRSRPSLLSSEEYDQLAQLHSKYGSQHPVRAKIDHLACLVHLAETMTIDISRIYQYFYGEQQSLFVVGGLQ